MISKICNGTVYKKELIQKKHGYKDAIVKWNKKQN